MMRVVLASASPRRRELMAGLGLDVEVEPADVDERTRAGERPDAYVRRVATAKVMSRPGGPDRVVLGADTAVVIDGLILGKPADAFKAADMLRRLSGRRHDVHTAVAVRHPDGPRSPSERRPDTRLDVIVVTTRVRMAPLGAATIDWYVATGEPMDKAGAYAIQGRGAALVTAVRGSVSNVVGLPLAETIDLLRRVPGVPAIGPLR